MKVDLKKTLDSYRATAGEFRTLVVPPLQYLMVDGHGDPNTAPAYADALATLFPLAYAVKFASKRELARDYVVPPLEALWWADDLAAFTSKRDKGRWHWTVLLMVPDWVPAAIVEDAVAAAAGRGLPRRGDVRFESLDEGLCVQTLHLGPYDDEAGVLDTMHSTVIPEAGLQPTGTHHEVYLSDPRRVAAARLRTILRQPVARDG